MNHVRRHARDRLVKLLVAALLLVIGYVYLYPLLKMLSQSLMDAEDIVDPNVNLVPTHLTLVGYARAMLALDMPRSLLNSIWLSLVLAVCQTLSASFVGYGFARFDFRFKGLMLALVLATFIVPGQVTVIPRLMVFSRYGLVGTVAPLVIVALFAQGINGPIFILIFYNFFRLIPRAIDEAAQLEGASFLVIFWKIVMRVSAPIVVVAFLFSFVWNWNETYLTGLITSGKFSTLPLKLEGFAASYAQMMLREGSSASKLNEAIRMAGTLVAILPMLLLYAFLQRQFVEGIERTGITGE